MVCGAEPAAWGKSHVAAEKTVMMTRPVVTRADAAILLRLPLPMPGDARRGVLRLPISGVPRLISAEALAGRAGLSGRQPRGATLSLSYSAPRRIGTCYAIKSAVAAGSSIHPDQLVQARCDGAVLGAVRYDSTTTRTLAMQAIPAGTRLGRLAPSLPHAIAAGANVTVRSAVGLVTIDRQMTALQSGDPGSKVFVRAGTGPAFAVPVARTAGEGQ